MIIKDFVPIRLGGQYCVAWLNMGVIVLLMVLMTLITLYPTITLAFQYMEDQLKLLCSQINQAAYQINQVSFLINQYIQQVHQCIVQHIQRGLIMMIDIIKYVILWLVDIYKSTYRCLFVFTINTLLSVLTIITKPLQQITESVLKGVDTIIDSIGSTLFHQENVSSLPTTLSNWTLSTEETQKKVHQWSTYSTDTLHEWISQPFDLLQQKINKSIIHDTSMMNHSLAVIHSNHNNDNNNGINQSSSSSPSYIYTINENASYCNLNTVIHDLHEAESSIKLILHIGIIIVVILMMICIILKMMYLRYRHRYLQRLRFQVIDDILSIPDHDLKILKWKEESSITSTSTSLTQIQKNNILLKQESILSYYGQVNQSPILFSMLNYFFLSFHSSSPSSFSFKKWQEWLFYITQSNAFMYCFYISTLGLLICYLLLFILNHYLQSTILPQLDTKLNEWMVLTINNATLLIQTELNTQRYTTNQWITTSENIINTYLFGSIRKLVTPLNMSLNTTIHHYLNFFVQFPRLKFMNYPLLSFHLTDLITSKSILYAIEHQLQQQIYYYWILVGLWFIGALIGFIYVKKYSSV
ncbi:unnamed protein product [Cunninghamella blakesleeana]